VLKKIPPPGAHAPGGGIVVAYGIDAALVAWPGSRQMYADIRVDQLYTDTNKWHELEYSRGDSVTERCVYALFPHGGNRPCWYVTRHTMQVTNTD